MADTGKTIGLIKALASVDPEVIQSSVEGWLDDHPEATTTVQDGSITKAKLDQNLQSTVDDVGDLKSAINDVDNAIDIQYTHIDVAPETYNDACDFFKYNNSIYVRSDTTKWFKAFPVTANKNYLIMPSAGNYIYCFTDSLSTSGLAGIVDNSYTQVENGGDLVVTAPSGAMYLHITASDGITVTLGELTGVISGAVDAIEERVETLEADVGTLKENVGNITGYIKGTQKKPLIVETWAQFPFRKQCTFANGISVSGEANSPTLSVAGTNPLSSGDIYGAVVIEHDSGEFLPYVITAYTEESISVYPVLKSAVTNKTLTPYKSDSQHLTANGFKSYMQYINGVNPKHCDKNKYIARYCPMTSAEIISTNPFTKLSGTPNPYSAALNDGLDIVTQQGMFALNIIPYTDYSTPSEYGVQWEVSTGENSGYLETYIGTNYSLFRSNGYQFVKDTGYEMHIEVYADNVLIFSKEKTSNIIERICVDYTATQDKIKLKVYYTHMRNQKDTIAIGETTFWVNESYPAELLPKEATVSMLFDSWGAFFNDDVVISQPADGWHISAEWNQGISGETLKDIMSTKNGFATPVFNTSRSGMTSRWGRSWLGVAVKDHNPNVMLTDFGINDYNTTIVSTYTDFLDPYGNTVSMSAPLTQAEYAENMKYIFDSCLISNILPVFVGGNVGSELSWILYLINAVSEPEQ